MEQRALAGFIQNKKIGKIGMCQFLNSLLNNLIHIPEHGIFFMGVGLYYISQNVGRGVNFSGGIFVYYCIFITKYFRKT